MRADELFGDSRPFVGGSRFVKPRRVFLQLPAKPPCDKNVFDIEIFRSLAIARQREMFICT